MTSAFPYMQLYTADHLVATSHLNPVEYSAYSRLMLSYWTRSKSFKARDKETLDGRLANMAGLSIGQWLEVKETVAEFFETSDTEWRLGWIERSLNAAKEKAKANQENGKKGAKARWGGDSQAIAGPSIGHKPGHSENMAILDIESEEERREEYISTSSRAREMTTAEAKKLLSQVQRVLTKAWPEIPPILEINFTESMAANIAENIGLDQARASPEFWAAVAQRARASSYLRGEVKYKGRYFSGFSLNWFVKPDHVANIESGLYDDKTPKGSQPASRRTAPADDENYDPVKKFGG